MAILRRSLVTALILGIFACAPPEEKMRDHFLEIQGILSNSLRSPSERVDDLDDYLVENGAEILELQGELSVSIMELDGETERADRLKAIEGELAGPQSDLRRAAMRFGLRVAEDQEARHKLTQLNRRYGDAIGVGIIPLAREAYPYQGLD